MEKILSSNVSAARLRQNYGKNYSNRIPFTAAQSNPAALNQNPNVAVNNNEDQSQKQPKKWTSRDYIDAATVALYSTIVAATIGMKIAKPSTAKKFTALVDHKKAVSTLRGDLTLIGKIKQGEANKGGPLYRLFDTFGKYKKNSAELTNNLIYGFGTLVVMPLVIVFSPIGKKGASKEDRTFTVLRQPISFATVFTIQYTFEKMFKALMGDLNKYRLLDGIKVKDKNTNSEKELLLSNQRIKEVLNETFEPHGIIEKNREGKNVKFYHFNDKIMDTKDGTFKSERELLKEHLFSTKKNFIDGGASVPLDIQGKGNKFTLDEFTDAIMAFKDKMGDDPTKLPPQKPGKIAKEATKEVTKTIMAEKSDKLKQLLSHYENKIPQMSELIDNIAHAAARSTYTKEFSAIVANSVLSQALGIMMLNFVYGKGMKKYGKLKESMAPKEQSPVERSKAVEGGSK